MKTSYESPLGIIIINFNDKQIKSIELCRSKKIKNNYDNDNEVSSHLKKCFDRYFQGETHIFQSFPQKMLCFQGTEFQESVWLELSKVSPKKTISYSTIAQKLNKPKAYRAVGSAVGKNPFFILLPCHRVLGKNKTLNGFAYGLEAKKFLLNHEGLKFIPN